MLRIFHARFFPLSSLDNNGRSSYLDSSLSLSKTFTEISRFYLIKLANTWLLREANIGVAKLRNSANNWFIQGEELQWDIAGN
jgi:hypothetical protein